MALTTVTQHLVCNCYTAWSGTTPPPPCPYHEMRKPQAYNGLCSCPAQPGLHPLHEVSWTSTTFTTGANPVPEYRGKHRTD